MDPEQLNLENDQTIDRAQLVQNLRRRLEEVTVVIPCAGEVPDGLMPIAGKSSPALIPLNGKPVILHTLAYLRSIGYRKFIVATRANDHLLSSILTSYLDADCHLQVFAPDHDGGLGYTVLRAIERVQTPRALIVLGDTFFKFDRVETAAVHRSFLLVQSVSDFGRWCIAEGNEERRLIRFVDKPETYSGDGQAVIGVYGISDVDAFERSLLRSWANEQNSCSLPLSIPLADYAKEHSIRLVPVNEWMDCGHPDTLSSSRRHLLASRSHNRIVFNKLPSTVTKHSSDSEKFSDEINYYNALPHELAIYFPRVVQSTLDPLEIELEYYPYPTLSELLLYEQIDKRVWSQLFVQLQSILKEFARFGGSISRTDFDSMYTSRIRQRADKLAEQHPELHRLVRAEALQINDKRYLGLDRLWPDVLTHVQRLYRTEDICIIHGDLCFSNVLYDLTAHIARFIDPRGSFGAKGIYGDRKYDIAKLYQSIHGRYDCIVQDLFSLTGSGDKYEIEVASTSQLKRIEEAFSEVFFDSVNRKEVQLIEGLLFISMGVFHSDSLKRQLAMFLTGIELIHKALNS